MIATRFIAEQVGKGSLVAMRNKTPNYKYHTAEREFSQQVEGLLKLFRWRYSHFRPARSMKGWRTPLSGDKGFPDIVAVRSGMCLFIELKSEKGKLTDDQEEWIRELKAIADHSLGVMTFVWRPSDFEEIAEILK